MTFLNNKYTTWYFNIVNYAKEHPVDNKTYSERHHILPRCMGGSNNDDNLVTLTARQHFICHMLLTKMTTGQNYRKMLHAAIGMRRARAYQDRYINSRLYDTIRKAYGKLSSERNKGKKASEEARKKMSESRRGKKKPDGFGEKISAALKGKPKGPMSEEEKLKRSNTQKGRPSHKKGKKFGPQHTPESKARIAESNRRRGCSAETKARIAAGVKASNERKKLLAATC